MLLGPDSKPLSLIDDIQSLDKQREMLKEIQAKIEKKYPHQGERERKRRLKNESRNSTEHS